MRQDYDLMEFKHKDGTEHKDGITCMYLQPKEDNKHLKTLRTPRFYQDLFK